MNELLLAGRCWFCWPNPAPVWKLLPPAFLDNNRPFAINQILLTLAKSNRMGPWGSSKRRSNQKKSVLFSSPFVPSSNPCFSSIYLSIASPFFSSQCARISVEIALQWMGCTWKIVVKSHKTFKQASLQQRDKLPFEVWRESPSACDFKLFVPFSSTREYKT